MLVQAFLNSDTTKHFAVCTCSELYYKCILFSNTK